MKTDPVSTRAAAPPDFQRLYRLQVEELPDYALFLIDVNGHITSWNVGVETMLQYAREDFVSRLFADLFTPEDRTTQAPEMEMETAATKGRSADVRWHLRRDGSRVFVDGFLYAIRDDDGQLVGYSKVMRDATARHEAEAALRESEAFARSIVESSPDCVKVLDLEGRLQSMNRAGCRAMDMDDFESSVNQPWLDSWQGEERAAAARSLAAARAGKESSFEGFCPTNKGTPKWWEVIIAPIKDDNGTPTRILCILRDITERKEAAKLMQRSHQNLAEFAHVVSHDLQAPLRTMKSYAQLLSKRYRGKFDDSADTFISFILEGAQNMEELIRGLLHYAEFGEDGERRLVELSEVVDTVLTTLTALVEESHAKITCGELPVIDANPTQIQQVFQNLISNALKYRSAAEPRIEVQAERKDRFWVVSVQDNGVGIAAEHFGRVFQPLKRLHGHEIAGTGLGLAVCKRIIESNGGQIWVESQPGVGSTFFSLYRPLRRR